MNKSIFVNYPRCMSKTQRSLSRLMKIHQKH